ncbi:MAG: hypothetical protein H6943_02040 [Zoogloeaceae bacterium]|nr:hypothetical protein [Zoogloeaceae bacterium]
MSDIWIALIICFVVVLSGALPLIRKRGNDIPPPLPKETLRDWRNDSRKN